MLDPFKQIKYESYDCLKNSAIHPSKFQILNPNYRNNKKIKWIRAWSLTNNKQYFIPLYCLIALGTNGLAAGNNIEEAILHGIFEVIERDIYTIMDLQEMIMPDLDLNSIKDKKVNNILKKLEILGLKYHIKYIINKQIFQLLECLLRTKYKKE